MADDPDRDILPVKESSCAETLFSAIDPRERHLVCKLDRYQLEDKYLRLLDETSNLKKLCNCQEDKIKRLGTKLIRLAGNPRSCGLTLDIAVDDRNRMSALELENTKLKEKITVMRNQLLSHTLSSRSSSRSRNLIRPTSSGLMTCRSENNRARAPSCQCIVDTGHDDSDARNYLVKIEKLEAQKKDMAFRITELEKELALYTTSSQREKVADNVEYIRVWRQMKQLNEKLITAQDKNVALTAEITDLKMTIEQTTRTSQEIAAVLTSERTRIAELDDQVLKAKNSEFALREKEEQIRDLMNEMKILQQHNNELIALSSKYGQVELENAELKKKLSDHVIEQQTLRTAFNNDQANIVALQATNKQLLAKLQELQTTIDTLTIQLATFHKQNEKHDVVPAVLSDAPTTSTANEKQNTKQCNISVEHCKKCCEMYDKVTQLEQIVDSARVNWRSAVKSVQTITDPVNTREQGIMANVEDEEKARSQLQSPLREWKMNQETNGLSREKILKLLDQAQINTSLDASRIVQKEDYILDMAQAQRHSDREILPQRYRDELNIIQKILIERKLVGNKTSSQILLFLLDVLQEYFKSADERASPSQVSASENLLIDVNNNLTAKYGDDLNVDATINPDDNNSVTATNEREHSADIDEYSHKNVKTIGCTCDDVKRCLANLQSDCCASCISGPTLLRCNSSYANSACKGKSVDTLTKDVGPSPGETTSFSTTYKTYEKFRKLSYRDISDAAYAEKNIRDAKVSMPSKCDLMCHLRKTTNSFKRDKEKLFCRTKCLTDSMELPVIPAQSYPLLITDRQGLIEIHISRLELSTSAAKIPEESDFCNLYVYINWNIWNEKTVYTSNKKCPNLNFDSSSVYRIADLFSFFKNVLSKYLVFRVNIVRQDNSSYTIARAKVSIKDILDYPQNKLHYIVPVSSVIPCSCDVNFGQLSLWVRLSCNVDIVETFKKQCGMATLRDTLLRNITYAVQKDEISRQIDTTSKFNALEAYDHSQKDSAIASGTLASARDTLPSPDSNSQYEIENSDDEMNHITFKREEYSSAVNETNGWFKEEKGKIPKRENSDIEAPSDREEILKEKALVESSSMTEFRSMMTNAGNNVWRSEGSSSTIRDMNEVLSEENWEKYRQRSLLTSASTIRAKLLNVDKQDYQYDVSTRELERDTITIEITSIVLFDDSSIMQDDDVHLLFVEYSFLGHYGEEMETASLKKPQVSNQEMIFNFKKKFYVDEKEHAVERNKLCAMLGECISPNIKFVLVSEPLLEETTIKECVDVGFATFNIRKYALGDGRRDILLALKDNRNKQVGVLKMIVLGFDTIKQCLAATSMNRLR